MKIYIIGNTEDYLDKKMSAQLKDTEELLSRWGYEPVSRNTVRTTGDWAVDMMARLALLKSCNGVCKLHGTSLSVEVGIEINFATKSGMYFFAQNQL